MLFSAKLFYLLLLIRSIAILASKASKRDTVAKITWKEGQNKQEQTIESSRVYTLKFGVEDIIIYRILQAKVEGKQNYFDTYKFVLNLYFMVFIWQEMNLQFGFFVKKRDIMLWPLLLDLKQLCTFKSRKKYNVWSKSKNCAAFY